MLCWTYFKSTVLRLRNKHPHHKRLNRAPDHEHNIQFPLDVLQRNWVRELVDQHGRGEGEVGERHALGAHLEGEDFDGVQRLQRGDTDGVDSAEEEDHRDSGLGGRAVGLVTAGKLRRGNRHADPNNRAARHGSEEHGATADLLDKRSTEEREDELEACISQVDVGLLDALRVA